MFSRLTSALLSREDILIAMSTSGKSKNILNAISAAKENNVHTILWMGNFDVTLSDTDIWKVPSKSTPRIQEVHLVWGHVLAEVVEEAWVISSKQTKQGL
jgi:D-sedoheptulose 7-phosphate isomerase